MTDPLEKLAERGQSVWLDYISRDLIASGQLQRFINECHVTGLTSNPTIFEKALAEGTAYDDQLRDLVDAGASDLNELFLSLAVADIQDAADILRPVYERSNGFDGFVSLEVPPSLAHNTETTVATAAKLWDRVNRPNLMVKIPATSEGVPAIEESIATGLNVNVTLIFSLRSYEHVANAYKRGLQRRLDQNASLHPRSVASFFVSRVDTAVDEILQSKLAQDSGNSVLRGLLGTAAIANAASAYEQFERLFKHDEGFARLQRAGAMVQRPLWASTSAKNPEYRDVVYAEALIGPDTVDTMPPSTIDAFRDHGIVEGDTVNCDYAAAHRTLDHLSSAGVDMESLTKDLLHAGVEAFTVSYDRLIRTLAAKVDSFRGGNGSQGSTVDEHTSGSLTMPTAMPRMN